MLRLGAAALTGCAAFAVDVPWLDRAGTLALAGACLILSWDYHVRWQARQRRIAAVAAGDLSGVPIPGNLAELARATVAGMGNPTDHPAGRAGLTPTPHAVPYVVTTGQLTGDDAAPASEQPPRAATP